MQHEDISFHLHDREGGAKAGLVLLDRPKALNALSYEMAVAIRERLGEWAQDAGISHVVIAGATPRAFCAGGDVRALQQKIAQGHTDMAAVYFRAEYMVDIAVYEFPKPVVCLADGIVMGGGAGIMQCGTHQVVSENTRFAMPEASIGLFPDAGASIFLGRCPRALALCIGLTGRMIGAADCLMLGLAGAMVPADGMAELRAALLGCGAGRIDDVIAGFRADPGPAPLQAAVPLLERIFAGRDLVAMRETAGALAAGDSSGLAAEIHQALGAKCPMTMHVFLRLIDETPHITDMARAIALDYHLAIRMSERGDFIEGIRAVLIDKTNDAKWAPSRLEDVTPDMVDRVFAHEGLAPLR